jgi:hypothetical protein
VPVKVGSSVFLKSRLSWPTLIVPEVAAVASHLMPA